MSGPAGGREVRLGLVLYGGVSLAVYINGVTLECLRLVRASRGEEENGYRRLLEQMDARVSIDIISGTSAGGINGVALAKALACGLSMEPLKQVWRRDGDLERLMHGPRDRAPRALLDETYYERSIRNALNMMDANPQSGPLVDALDLFVSATDLTGRVQGFTDYLGHNVRTRQHRKSFALKYRRPGYSLLDRSLGYERNDFAPEHTERLVRICRATSAFPVAFRPLRLQRASDDPSLFEPEEPRTVSLSDGGILNNKPFSDAVRAIFSRSADRKVDRLLLFVEPDPESFPVSEQEPREPNFLEVASRALSGVPTYQSISADLQSLEEHNRRVERYHALRARLEAALERALGPATAAPGAATPAFRHLLEGQIGYSGYLEVKLRGVLERLEGHTVQALGRDTPAQQAAAAWLRRRAGSSQGPGGLRDFLGAFDTPFRVRKYYHLLQAVDAELDAAERAIVGAGLPPGPAAALAAYQGGLRALASLLWDALDRARDVEWRAWTLEGRGWFGEELSSLGALRSSGPGLERRVDALLASMQETLLSRHAVLRLQGLAAAQALERALGGLQSMAAAAGVALPPGGPPLSRLFEEFEVRDLFLYPLEALSDLGERDPVDVVRVSPGDATYIVKGPGEKLAGDTLFHFGGFLKESWRSNDIMWGRLDAAEVLARALLWSAVRQEMPEAPPEAQQAELRRRLEAVLPAIQQEVALQELPPQVTARPGFSYKRYLEEEWNVGAEGLEDVPGEGRLRLAARALRVLRGMLQGVADDKDSHASLRAAGGFLSRALGWVNRVVGPIADALSAPDPLVKRAYTLGLLGLWAWGALTLLLWGTGVLPLNGRVIALAFGAFLPLLLYTWLRRTWWGVLLSLAVPASIVLLAARAYAAVPAVQDRLCDWLCR